VGGSKAGGLPHPSLFPFPPLPVSIPPEFSDKPVGGKVRSSDGEVPRLPHYKHHPAANAETSIRRADVVTSGTEYIFRVFEFVLSSLKILAVRCRTRSVWSVWTGLCRRKQS